MAWSPRWSIGLLIPHLAGEPQIYDFWQIGVHSIFLEGLAPLQTSSLCTILFPKSYCTHSGKPAHKS